MGNLERPMHTDTLHYFSYRTSELSEIVIRSYFKRSIIVDSLYEMNNDSCKGFYDADTFRVRNDRWDICDRGQWRTFHSTDKFRRNEPSFILNSFPACYYPPDNNLREKLERQFNPLYDTLLGERSLNQVFIYASRDTIHTHMKWNVSCFDPKLGFLSRFQMAENRCIPSQYLAEINFDRSRRGYRQNLKHFDPAAIKAFRIPIYY